MQVHKVRGEKTCRYTVPLRHRGGNKALQEFFSSTSFLSFCSFFFYFNHRIYLCTKKLSRYANEQKEKINDILNHNCITISNTSLFIFIIYLFRLVCMRVCMCPCVSLCVDEPQGSACLCLCSSGVTSECASHTTPKLLLCFLHGVWKPNLGSQALQTHRRVRRRR